MSSTNVARSEGVVFVQLRLDPAMAEALRAAGKHEDRGLPAEIVHRLQASLGGDAAVASIMKPLGALAARIRKLTGYTSETDRPKLLALLRDVLPNVLDRMGADGSGLTEDGRAIARALANGRF